MQTDQTKHKSPLQALRRVSGRLRRLLKKEVADPKNAPPNLLVVDDEESICFSLKEYFSHNGFIVDTAKEIEEAEKLISKSKYRVVIQDLRMGPKKDVEGLHMVRLLHTQSPETRVVILTAYGTAEIEDEARLLGADAFLKKPQPLSQVAQVVRGLIESPKRVAPPPA